MAKVFFYNIYNDHSIHLDKELDVQGITISELIKKYLITKNRFIFLNNKKIYKSNIYLKKNDLLLIFQAKNN